MFRPLAVAVLVLVGFVAPARAQDTAPAPATPPQGVELRLRDGSVLFGRIVEERGDVVVLLTSVGGRLEVPRAEIVRIRQAVRQDTSGEYWIADPNPTRLFFTSTARPLAAGEGYVSSYFLFFPFVAVGVTDRFTFAAGTPILPFVVGRTFYYAPKLTLVNQPSAAFAIGALGSFDVREVSEDGSTGIAYAVGTFGNNEDSFTAGLGWNYSTSNRFFPESNGPTVVLGGETRISSRT